MSNNADLFDLIEGCANYAEAAIDLLLGYVEQEEGLIEHILRVREWPPRFAGLRAREKIRGNHSLRKQNPHQRTSYWLD